MPVRGRECGQATIEYTAVLALVGLLFGAVLSAGVDRPTSARLARAVCWMPVVQDCGRWEAGGPAAASRTPLSAAALRARAGSRATFAPERPPSARSAGAPAPSGAELAADRLLLARTRGERILTAAEASRSLEVLAPAERRRLALRHPEEVGGLDGAPASMRYEANRELMRRSDPLLAARARRLDARVARERALVRTTTLGRLRRWRAIRVATSRRETLELRRRQVRRWRADPSRHFMVFDPDGDGRAAEVVGDLERAPHVAVMVPGTGSDIDNFEANLAPRARTLRRAGADRAGADVATVAWLGYDPPDTVPAAALGGSARAGGRSLTRFVAGVSTRNPAHVSVVGHSYGSVTTGYAAAEGRLRARDVVFTGSPGSGGHRIDVRALGRRSRYWAGEAPGDLVPWAPVHGESPSARGFGARRFDATGRERPLTHVVDNHQSYYEPGSRSLENIALIVGGRPGEVAPAPGTRRGEARRGRR